MGTKFSKDERNENVSKKVMSANKDAEEGKETTTNFDRHKSFSKRFRKSCRRFISPKGLVAKEHEKNQEIHTEKNIQNTSTEETKELDTVLYCSESTAEEITEVDIGLVVADLVLGAHAKKLESKEKSIRERLMEPNENEPQKISESYEIGSEILKTSIYKSDETSPIIENNEDESESDDKNKKELTYTAITGSDAKHISEIDIEQTEVDDAEHDNCEDLAGKVIEAYNESNCQKFLLHESNIDCDVHILPTEDNILCANKTLKDPNDELNNTDICIEPLEVIRQSEENHADQKSENQNDLKMECLAFENNFISMDIDYLGEEFKKQNDLTYSKNNLDNTKQINPEEVWVNICRQYNENLNNTDSRNIDGFQSMEKDSRWDLASYEMKENVEDIQYGEEHSEESISLDSFDPVEEEIICTCRHLTGEPPNKDHLKMFYFEPDMDIFEEDEKDIECEYGSESPIPVNKGWDLGDHSEKTDIEQSSGDNLEILREHKRENNESSEETKKFDTLDYEVGDDLKTKCNLNFPEDIENKDMSKHVESQYSEIKINNFVELSKNIDNTIPSKSKISLAKNEDNSYVLKENNETMDEDFFTPVVYTDNGNDTADSTATIVTTLVTGILKTVVDVTSYYQSPGANAQSDDDAESEVSTDEGIVATDDDDENK